MDKFKSFDAPMLGVDYYPEDWPDEEIDRDIERMKVHHIKLIRFAEFAWSKIEPREGEFHFEWIENVVNRFGEAGIESILCTQSATPPMWLVRKYPDARQNLKNGRTSNYGGRRYMCENHAGYRKACMKVTEEIAKRFANNPHVVGWQIDNEIWPYDDGCFCENCVRKFREYLRDKYGTIENVNEKFLTAHLFSQAYDSFDDIPAPRDGWMNPHLVMEWRNFKTDSLIDFVHDQCEILHKYSDAPVGTDVMPVPYMSYRRMFEPMDVVMFNHYNTPDDLEDVTFWFDHLRTLKERPFWNTETAVNWNGSVAISQSIKPEGYCFANSWLPVAMGGEANMYWLFRTHHAGHELMHGALFDTCGKPAHTLGEVDRVGEGFDAAADILQKTKPVTKAAIVYSPLAGTMSSAQPIVEGFNYMDEIIHTFHHGCMDAGLDTDVIDPAAISRDGAGVTSKYKVIITPMLMSLEEADAGKRLEEFVKNGGIWICAPFTDIRDMAGGKFMDRHFGMLEKFAGVNWLYGIPDTENRLGLVKTGASGKEDGTDLKDRWWVDVFDEEGLTAADGAEVFARVKSGYSTLVGKPVSFAKKIGKGTVIVLGTFPDRKEFCAVAAKAADDAGIGRVRTEAGSVVVSRGYTDDAGNAGGDAAPAAFTAVETHDRKDILHIGRPVTDLLTGEKFDGDVPMEPYAVRVLKA